MIEITISGNTYDEAHQLGMEQLGVPADAVEVVELSHAMDDLLPGAEPLPGVTLRFRVREDVLLAKAKAHLIRLLELIGVDAKVETTTGRRGMVLNIIAGEEGSLIIGKNGQNLDAFQYLINRMTTRSTRDLTPIIVDSESYREKRLQKLEDLARRTARRVIRSGREVALEPMPASERKAIHIIVKELRGVHSISRGENEERHIVITPAQGEGPPPNVFRGRPSQREMQEGTQRRREGGREGGRGGRPHGGGKPRRGGGPGGGHHGRRRNGPPEGGQRRNQDAGGTAQQPRQPGSTPKDDQPKDA